MKKDYTWWCERCQERHPEGPCPKKPDDTPAFPRDVSNNNYHDNQTGMSLRDHFAGKYGPQLVGDAEILRSVIKSAGENGNTVEIEVAEQAYDYADAMLEVRKR